MVVAIEDDDVRQKTKRMKQDVTLHVSEDVILQLVDTNEKRC